jgi:hypothetical protein
VKEEAMSEKNASSTEREDPALTAVREKVSKKLGPGPGRRYRSLGEAILDGTGSIVERLTFRLRREPRSPNEKPVSQWYSAVVVALAVLIVGFCISLALGEKLSPKEVLFSLWAVALGGLLLIANRSTILMFKTTFRGGPRSPLDAISSQDDLNELQTWLDANFAMARPLAFGLILGPVAGLMLFALWVVKNGVAFHAGPAVIAGLSGIQSVLVIYYLYPFYVAFPARFSRYRLELYPLDPSSSQVIDALSDLFTGLMYITLAYIIGFIASLYFLEIVNPGTGLLLVVTAWIPVLALYGLGQFGLSRAITRVKWETLDSIQGEIKRIQTGKVVPSKKKLTYLDELMSYHERIKGTKNSAVDLRARLSFLNTLVLPLLAFALANWESLTKAIRDAFR